MIYADETVAQVLKEDGKPATSESRMWLYASAALLKHQVRLFKCQPDRSGKRPEAFLKSFEWVSSTSYNLLVKVMHCGCWAHARRKWREAMPDGATVKTSKAAVGFQYCNKLFAEERRCAVYKAKKFRQNEVPISNNLVENVIRPFSLGRKNRLFCDTAKCAEVSAIVYSLVESAKTNGVEPFAYLQHVLQQLPYLGKPHSHEELESLIPWVPYIQQEFSTKIPTPI